MTRLWGARGAGTRGGAKFDLGQSFSTLPRASPYYKTSADTVDTTRLTPPAKNFVLKITER